MAITPVTLSSDDLSAIGQVRPSGITSKAEGEGAFDTILNAAVDMYKEADMLQKKAEETEMSFALGYTDSIHDLALAQQKANISLQYTVKVTNAVVSAYKELMNLQL
ncbi:MAG: flagellar hook-basal body complex protein FliE [Clostridium sp.]|nr:flagellar hook-basal body complex protein FliE [Clostridium sp.]MCM1398013.1 flagellar hook-basal body complex protein FliE [Clostridium sp.]MCM1459351.1 flagellar hook-basal body complex protein FliE [Bacteroides sp.]